MHPAHQHPLRAEADHGGWVGVDRGLSAFLIAATSDGEEVARIGDAPKALRAGMARQRRLSKSLSRKQKGSAHRRQAANWGGTITATPTCVGIPAPGFKRAGQDPRPARDRRPQRDRDAAQPPASPSDLRCRLGRVRPPPTLQAGLAWRRRLSGRPLVPVEQALPRMRDCSRRSEPGRARIHLWLWAFCRPRSQRGHQSSPLGPGPSRPSPIPGPPSRRPGHQRPRTGRR